MRASAAALVLLGVIAVFVVVDRIALHWYAEDVDDLESRIESLEVEVREQRDDVGPLDDGDHG